MDTDWCLTCNKRVEGSSLYCSLQCQYGAGPSNYHRHSLSSLAIDDDDYLEEYQECGLNEELLEAFPYDDEDPRIQAVSKTNWAGRGSAGIRAWAAEIPLGAHPEPLDPPSPPPPPPSSEDSFSVPSSPSTTSSTYRAPNLVRPIRPLPPSLTMSKPERAATTPPRPILNLQRHLAAISLTHSPGSTARTSVASEDSLLTPASSSAMPFSTLPGRPFPSISDARASDLAACTTTTLPPSPSSQKDEEDTTHLVRSRPVPIAPRIVSSPRSSMVRNVDGEEDFDLSPPWWVTGSMVARHATKSAATKPPSSRKQQCSMIISEATRGRKFARVAP